MESSKPWYYRVIALLCAFLICSCLVVFSFIVPRVKAQSVLDQWEDYTDEMFGEGASFIIEEMAEKGGGLPCFFYLWGLSTIPYHSYGDIPLSSISSVQGYYYYNGLKQPCQSVLSNHTGSVSVDSPAILAQSPDFAISIWTSGANVNRGWGYINSNIKVAQVGYQGDAAMTFHASGGGSIFNYGTLENISSNIGINCYYGSIIPTYSTALDPFNTYFWAQNNPSLSGHTAIAGGLGNNAFLDFGSFSNTIGVDSSSTVNSSNIIDFIVNVVNPAIEITYPDLFVYLFNPVEEETTDTSDSCNCVHNIYVDVTCYYDPEINVYVTEYITVENNVEVELPSDWVQDYTLTTDPYEVDTIPIPTQENSEPVTMPTIDASEYEEAYGNAIDFWFYVAQSFIEKMHLQLIIAFAFALSVVGFCLWKLGGGGKE